MTDESVRSPRWKKILVAVVVVAALAAGITLWKRKGTPEISYREVPVSRGDMEVTVFSTGVVQPENRLEIKPPVPGRIEEVLTDQGHDVKKGQVLAWMSSTERAALLDAARAQGPAELKKWEEFYKPTPIMAPLDGMIILRSVEPGQTVASNDSCFSLSDRLIVNAQVDETDIAQIREGEIARVVLDAYPDVTIPSKVFQIYYDAKTVNNVTTYQVDVLPVKTPEFMRSGMTANVYFLTASKKAILMLPSEAVKIQGDQSYVLARGSGEKDPPEARTVTTGVSDGKHIEILSGLTEGERVLIPQLRPSNGGGGGTNPFFPSHQRKK